jgi:Xaa-Pro aminopeptidase
MMHTEQRQRARELLHSRGVASALFAHPHSVTWLTGFAPPVQTGRNLFAGGPALVYYAGGVFTLVVVDAWADLAAPLAQEQDAALLTYQGYTIEQELDGPGNLRRLLANLPAASAGQAVGVEASEAPWAAAQLLADAGGGAPAPVAIDGWLHPLRMVKTDEELGKLRANFALGDEGHAAARAAAVAGASEIEVWAAVESAIQTAAGGRVPIGNDCVVGTRQNNIGGWPEDRRLAAGDSLIVDISVVGDGYWSDSCATYVAGWPSARQVDMHRVASETLALGAALLRPGAVCGEIDRAMRQAIEAAGYPVYPHHSGHGVGVSGHENPRIVPYSVERLAPGMVILLEPGIYFPGETGVRVEDGFLITEAGAVQLTAHDKRLLV